MLKFDKFAGINNAVPSYRLSSSDLTVGTDIDIGLTREVSRRAGYTALAATCHKNLWQAAGFELATVEGNDLKSFVGATYTTVSAALGTARVWYCNLPDGRTTFSNGSICGITDGGPAITWGVPIPASMGAAADVAGLLFPGEYRYMLTHVRLSDGQESGTANSTPVNLTAGGLSLTGLPVRAGHRTNIYLKGPNSDQGYLAGSTSGSTFSFVGANDQLVLPCRTDNLSPAPAGTVTAFWRGRILIAVGSVLWASMAGRWQHFNTHRDFKQMGANITLIQPVDDGVFVGTTKELCFLAGAEFDKLKYTRVVDGGVVLGSGVTVPGEHIKRGDRAGTGVCMICIADNVLVAGFADGGIARMTEGRYTTAVTEVAAAFRLNGRIPQYVAVPQ